MMLKSGYEVVYNEPDKLHFVDLAENRKKQLIQALFSLMPEAFLEELNKFVLNNTLTESYTLKGHQELHYCEQCFKAHAFKVSEDFDLDKRFLSYLDVVFPGEVGHDGYYINQEQLVKI